MASDISVHTGGEAGEESNIIASLQRHTSSVPPVKGLESFVQSTPKQHNGGNAARHCMSPGSCKKQWSHESGVVQPPSGGKARTPLASRDATRNIMRSAARDLKFSRGYNEHGGKSSRDETGDILVRESAGQTPYHPARRPRSAGINRAAGAAQNNGIHVSNDTRDSDSYGKSDDSSGSGASVLDSMEGEPTRERGAQAPGPLARDYSRASPRRLPTPGGAPRTPARQLASPSRLQARTALTSSPAPGERRTTPRDVGRDEDLEAGPSEGSHGWSDGGRGGDGDGGGDEGRGGDGDGRPPKRQRLARSKPFAWEVDRSRLSRPVGVLETDTAPESTGVDPISIVRTWLCSNRAAHASMLGPVPHRLREPYEDLCRMFRDFRRGHQALHVLLWGRRGAGKTHVLEAALADAGIAPGRTAVPVKLSGLVHVSEDIAMRALAAQLCEHLGLPRGENMTQQDSVATVVDLLGKLRQKRRGVVVVLDNAEVFARSSRQTLLYDILDSMHSAEARVMVVAVTPWADFLAKLEKRVRSRLDFKMVEVPMPRYQPEFEFGAGRAEEAEDEQEAAEDGIEREAAQHGVGTTMYVAADRPLLRIEEVARDMLVPAGVQAEDDAGWSAYVGSVDATLSDAGVQQALNELARENNDPRQLQVVCLHALERARDAGRGEESSRAVVALTPDALAGAAKHVLSLLNAPAHVLANRSVLDVLVAVAFVRLEQRGHEEINLQHIHAHYMDLKKANADGIPNFSLDNIQASVQGLVDAGLLRVVAGRLSASTGWRSPVGAFLKLRLVAMPEEVRAVVKERCGAGGDLPPVLLEWLEREAVNT